MPRPPAPAAIHPSLQGAPTNNPPIASIVAPSLELDALFFDKNLRLPPGRGASASVGSESGFFLCQRSAQTCPNPTLRRNFLQAAQDQKNHQVWSAPGVQ